MKELKNSEILKKIFHALYVTAGRRTSNTYAITIIGAITKTLVQKYDFLTYIKIDPKMEENDDVISINPDIDEVNPKRTAKAIEAIVRIIYMDLRSKAGLFFINEIKDNAGHDVIERIRELGIDLDLLQIEQHYIHRRFSRAIKPSEKIDNKSMLGYNWEDVNSWKYDEKSQCCVLFGEDGKILDELHLEKIIKKHIGFLSEDDIDSFSLQTIGTDIDEKEYELLKILEKRDMDFETAVFLLHIPDFKLN